MDFRWGEEPCVSATSRYLQLGWKQLSATETVSTFKMEALVVRPWREEAVGRAGRLVGRTWTLDLGLGSWEHGRRDTKLKFQVWLHCLLTWRAWERYLDSHCLRFHHAGLV